MLNRLATALAGRYRIERELGAGGMATVYLAEDLKHHRKVAIKVLREELAASVGPSRFLREIEICAQLQHPNILPLLDSGEAGGLLYYVMPYVEGQSLRQRLNREGELPVVEAIRILIEVVDALAYAHARGVVHRDIKPDNVMLSGRHALVADFGVARALSEASGQHTMTSAGMALGTPAYMSPEQAMADPHVDHRSDLYAVGAMAYELLAGRPPFTGHTPQQVLSAHVTESAEPVGTLRPGLAPALEQIVMRCLAKRPADRWQSGEELLAHLEPLATPSGGTQPTEARLPAVEGAGGRPWRVAAAGVVAVMTGLAIWFGVRSIRTGEVAPVLVIGNAVKLTAQEGLEIHPALSPDGRFIAYAAGQSTRTRVYIEPVGGGRTIALSERGSGLEFQPRWSPDGNQILYLTDDGVYVASALGGAARRVIEAADSLRGPVSTSTLLGVSAAAWSPDGQRIVSAHGGALWLTWLDGGGLKRLGTSPFELHSCDWSPRDDWIACVSGNSESVVPSRGFANIAPSAIVLIPTTGGSFVEITDRRVLHLSPVWAPDGEHLYFVSNRQGPRDIYVVRIGADGRAQGEPRRVTTGLGAHSIAFSRDGGRLAYGTWTARANIWSLPIPSGAAVDASTAQPVTSGNQIIEAMRVSRDHRWLLYDSNLHGSADIFRLSLEGGTPQRLTTDPADDFAPDLSPDGSEIAYHSWRTGTRDIVVQSLDGRRTLLLTNTPGQESYPVWSPDGRALVFYDQHREGDVLRGIYVTHRDASGTWSAPVHRRTDGIKVSWSPDGRFLAYARNGTLEVMPPDLGAPRVIYAPQDPRDPLVDEVRISNDGRVLYFKSHDAEGRARIWSLPMSGGRPRLLVRFDDLSRPSTRSDFAVGNGRFYFTLDERESDIWVADIVRP